VVGQISSVLFSSLQRLKTLQVVRLDGCAIGEANLSLIGSGCKELKELSLSKCQGVTDAGVVGVVAACTGLQKLDLTCCREITNVALEAIATNCKGLLSLKMENCLLVTSEGLVLIGRNCFHLEELDLTDCNLDDNGKSFRFSNMHMFSSCNY
jgi:F-box/leucine-rich repeat protein 2/20